jgi:hypothetical protein
LLQVTWFKKLAAFQKLIYLKYQNMIPAVEGLLPEPHNGKLMVLLFRLAEWHALAKLRMHTEYTLGVLTQSTATIGKELRSFEHWTWVFDTVELPGETHARDRRRKRREKPLTTAISDAANTFLTPESGPQVIQTKPSAAKPKKKNFNLFTYKLHALGDYVQTIRSCGSTDSYSTQIVRSQN